MTARPLIIALGLTTALAAAARPTVARAAADVPAYATSFTDQQIKGTVASFDGHYALAVRDKNGYVDRVRLHQGTIINPTGLTLAPGQKVTVLGRADGRSFDANEIDTPYHIEYAQYPAYAGYPGFGPGSYGYGYPYGFGYPSGGFGFGFGW